MQGKPRRDGFCLVATTLGGYGDIKSILTPHLTDIFRWDIQKAASELYCVSFFSSLRHVEDPNNFSSSFHLIQGVRIFTPFCSPPPQISDSRRRPPPLLLFPHPHRDCWDLFFPIQQLQVGFNLISLIEPFVHSKSSGIEQGNNYPGKCVSFVSKSFRKCGHYNAHISGQSIAAAAAYFSFPQRSFFVSSRLFCTSSSSSGTSQGSRSSICTLLEIREWKNSPLYLSIINTFRAVCIQSARDLFERSYPAPPGSPKIDSQT